MWRKTFLPQRCRRLILGTGEANGGVRRASVVRDKLNLPAFSKRK